MKSTENREHDFSIELKSNKNLTTLSTHNNGKKGALIEGTLGKHIKAAFLEATVLEVQGECGVLRLSICKEEIVFPKSNADQSLKEA